MRMLRTNQSKITRPLSIRVRTCSRQRVAQYIFQLELWKKKNIFFGVDFVVKNKLICALSWSVLLSTTTTRHYSSFPKHYFVLFVHFERVCKRFWASLQKVLKGKSDAYKQLICIMQRVHFLKVWVGVFSCQQILTEISFVIFDIVVKNRMSFSVALVKFHWFGIMH